MKIVLRKLYYSVEDGGDGSATPRFFINEKLSDMFETLQTERYDGGWGEPSTGSISVPDWGTIKLQNVIDNAEFISDNFGADEATYDCIVDNAEYWKNVFGPTKPEITELQGKYGTSWAIGGFETEAMTSEDKSFFVEALDEIYG